MGGLISQLIPHLGKKSPEIVTQKSRESAVDKTNHQATPPARIAHSIVHALPGRVRFHVPQIAQNSEYVQRLQALLKAEPWVTSERVNSSAASIVITYTSGEIPDSERRSHLASLIQSASDAVVAMDSTGMSTGRVTQESVSSSSHPQPATQPTILAGSLEVQQDAISSRFEQCTIQAAKTVPGSRVFVYEVVGLHQSEETDKMNYPIRRSGSVFIRVPYNRMNQEMQRLARMGGKIVSIQLLNADSEAHGKATSVTSKSEVKSQAP
jgi:sulfite reductase alpha subunit-like flavoprotein